MSSRGKEETLFISYVRCFKRTGSWFCAASGENFGTELRFLGKSPIIDATRGELVQYKHYCCNSSSV